MGKERIVLEAIAALQASGHDLARVDEPGAMHDLPREVAQSAARKLVAKGLIIRRGIGRYGLTAAGRRALAVPGLTTDPARAGGRARPRRGTDERLPYELAWNVIRIRRRFTHAEVMTVLEDADPRNIRGYIAGLVAAGYVRVLYREKRSRFGGGSAPRQYALVHDTGAAAPSVRRRKGVVHDPNLRRDVPMDGVGLARADA